MQMSALVAFFAQVMGSVFRAVTQKLASLTHALATLGLGIGEDMCVIIRRWLAFATGFTLVLLLALTSGTSSADYARESGGVLTLPIVQLLRIEKQVPA